MAKQRLLTNLDMTVLQMPYHSCEKRRNLCSFSYVRMKNNPFLAFRYENPHTLFGSQTTLRRFDRIRRHCNDDLGEKLARQNEELVHNFNSMDDDIDVMVKHFDQNCIGIKSEKREWQEKDENLGKISRQNTKSFDMTMPIRMIDRKEKPKYDFVNRDEIVSCSLKKAFSSVVSMVTEIQSSATHLTESLCSEDLHGIMGKIEIEMKTSFIWHFQQVFYRTPDIMLYVILTLANFISHSMVCIHKQADKGVLIESFRSDLEPKREMEEMRASKSSRFEVKSSYGDYEGDLINQFGSRLKLEMELDNYIDYGRTDLWYQMAIVEDPNNGLLLLNYARFLYMVPKDYDRAEMCFRKAIMIKPIEAEALCRYADFLWIVRKDMWGAEERFQEAIAIEPHYHYIASQYANFLWKIEDSETSFPLNDQVI